MAEWVLERIGLNSPDVVFNKSYLTCGRMKDQDIVCLSLLVSRQHCEFTLLQDGLSVIDLGSSNGVFINGQQIRARQRFMLKENDYVGIGCSNIESLDASMFVYRVKKKATQNMNQNRKRQPGARQPLTTIPTKIQKLSVDDGDIEVIECIDDDLDVIPEKQVNPFVKPVTKEDPKVVSPVKSNDGNVQMKAQVGECSSTSNNDNEVESTSKNSAKISEKDDLPSRKENLNNNVPNTSNQTENLKSNKQKIVPEIIDISEPDPINIKSEPMQLDEVGTSDVNTANPDVDSARADAPSPVNDDNAEVGTTNSAVVKQELASVAVENHLPSADDNEEFDAVDNESNFPNNVNEENESGCYSQIDLVELDDEDDFFPSSQLFNKSVIKEEVEEAADNEQAHDSVYLDDEDENVITIVDSDDEIYDSNYFDKLVQNIKPEPVSTHEFIVPDILDNYDNMAVDNLDPLTNEVVSSSTRMEIDSTTSIPVDTEANDKNKKLANNEETDSSARLENASTIDKPMESCKEQASTSLHDPLAPSTSKSISSPKPKKKGVEIIEPHHMKPKKSRHSSDSNSSSSSRRDKKSKKHKSSSSLKKSSHHSSSNSRSKDKEKSSSKSHKSSSESKEKKEDDKTNDSINQSASSSKKPEEPEKPKNRTTIVKAKVSSKSRGDMLCESMINLRPTPRTAIKKPEPAKTAPAKAPERAVGVVHPSVMMTRREVPLSSTRPAVSPMNSPPSEVRNVDDTTNGLFDDLNGLNSAHTSTTSRLQFTSTILQNTTNLKTSSSTAARPSPSDTESIGNDPDLASNSVPLKPSLTISLQNGNNKRVSFKENIASVKEFPIDPGNSMRNIREGTKSVRDLPKPLELKIEDFLARVFAWEPTWLEQQQKVKELPPIIDKAKLLPLPNTFNCFEQYYKRMEVLLLLETWQLLLKEYECSGSKYKGSQVLCCAIERESIKQQLTPNRLRYSKLEVKTIVTKDELKNKSNPVYGDMIILEYTIKVNGQVKWRRAFAYVVEVRQQNSLRSLPSNHPLFKRINNPHAIITYTVQTRVIDEHTVQFEKLARLRSILYLRPHLRSIKGLQYVPRSALRDSILHVDIDEYNIDPDGTNNVSNMILGYDLVTKDHLNEKQTEAVVKFTDAATNMKSKIGLLVGPPGTGKSRVITNLVIQMIYGEGRFVSGNAKRILVCAPSNAAIDEIVLRLLEIRGAITNREHRFRMVRIGREECMHDEVKKISIAELARKEAERQFVGNKQKLLEDVEHKKHMLMKTIQSLNALIASDPHSRAKYEIELEHKRAKYEKLAHRSPEADQMERNKLEINAKTMILQKAHVIACTLSSCYNGQMEAVFGGHTDHIATCIVDEATQCCEAETLIPLMLGVKNLFLVGDPNQLPATVMSTDAKKLGLDRSLFTRAKEALETQLDNIPDKNKDPVIMLKEQYRMVSAISYWPNRYFYKGRLIDRVAYKTSFPYHPYRILNVDGAQDDNKFSNTGEAVFVGNLVNALMSCSKVHDLPKVTIGIITPYQNQRKIILTKISEQTRSVPLEIRKKFDTECNTIDSFQGQERDVIIMSCVRSHGIGFLSDPQRLCVALTRAKHTLIICGNLTPFKKDKMWENLLNDGRSRGLIVNLNKNASPNDIKPHVVSLF